MPPTTALQDEANATHGELLTLIAELKRDVHKIGTRLFKLQQNHLYRHVDGSPKTWEAYLEDHLHLGHAQANKYVKIAASFSEDYTAISKIEVLSLFLGWLEGQAMEVPADHATRTFVTPGGLAKRLDQLTVHEAELLFNPPATHPPAPPAAGPVGDSDLALYQEWKGRRGSPLRGRGLRRGGSRRGAQA